jgi:uncharacterized membrane protein SpoIIM required for sporulation
MREGKFLKKNINKWESYMTDTDDPDEQASRFVHLIDDLSYSKTFYPRSTTTDFLNGLAAKTYSSIYANKKQSSNRFVWFWKYELPTIMYKYRKIYLFTFCFFTLFVAIGVIASINDPDFVTEILGSNYVEMTQQNIDNGDPFGVYKQEESFMMFVYIALNNIRVSFMVFVYGLFLGIGCLYMLFQNAIMLGTFQHMFFAKGLGWPSILCVWTHGTLEINAIVLAGTAGLILGISYLFPGTYSRMQSFTKGAKDAVKILIALIPIFVVAAWLEGYITRHTEVPEIISIGILLLSEVFIIYYFILYPRKVVSRGIEVINGELHQHGNKVSKPNKSVVIDNEKA